ncbi:hypothetical protein IU440_28875 [Nocardia cyriacigeorgica]|nr:hypothetical protein [Nocardia cyriacigeorgica]
MSSVGLTPIHYVETVADSEGTPDVEVTDAKSMDSDATGEGTASADAVPVTTVEASSSGSADIGVGIYADSTSEGTGSAIATMVGLVTATASSEGTASADLVTFTAVRMDKSNTQSWPQGTSNWVTVTSWTPEAGSSVFNDQLVLQGTKTDATITVRAPYTGAFFSNSHAVRAVDQNGTVLATSANVTTGSGTCSIDASNVDLTGITSIGIQIRGGSQTGNGTLQPSGCYLSVT